jgi:hypothetical protein
MNTRTLKIALEVAQMSSVPLDRLAYTDEFETLWTEFVRRAKSPYTRGEVYQYLLSVRKRGLLARRIRGPRKDNQ